MTYVLVGRKDLSKQQSPDICHHGAQKKQGLLCLSEQHVEDILYSLSGESHTVLLGCSCREMASCGALMMVEPTGCSSSWEAAAIRLKGAIWQGFGIRGKI
jgi:hypothetical protein